MARLIRLKGVSANAGWSLFGVAAPMVAALLAVPSIVSAIGTERFGVVSIFWLTVGYFSLFDLGLGRATTQMVAEYSGRGDARSLGPQVGGAILLLVVLGAFGGLALALGASFLTEDVLSLSPDLRTEGYRAFLVLALALPAVTVSTGLRGVLEARQRFRAASLVRLGLGLATFLGPLALVPFKPTLVSIAAVLVASRWLATMVLVPLCLQEFDNLLPLRARRAELISLLRFGGWITVSNIVSPLMANIDRFWVGSLLGATAVAYYATPFEMVTKLNVLPGALVTALFPVMAAAMGAQARSRAGSLLERGMAVTICTMSPLLVMVAMTSRWTLDVWLGHEFALNSSPVLRILALGVLVNGLASFPASFLQAGGRPDLCAKFHLLEFPVYLASLWYLTIHFGIAGVAAAWTLRVGLDLVLLCAASARIVAGGPRWGHLGGSVAVSLASIGLASSEILWVRLLSVALGMMAVVSLVPMLRRQGSAGEPAAAQ